MQTPRTARSIRNPIHGLSGLFANQSCRPFADLFSFRQALAPASNIVELLVSQMLNPDKGNASSAPRGSVRPA
jgi:hypothetical protein